MRPKNPERVTNWSFYLTSPSDEEIRIPDVREGSISITALLARVANLLHVFDEATNGEYTKQQRELAAQAGLEWNAYLRKLILHQFCLRNNSSIPCYNEGGGDLLHNTLTAVDGYVAKTPERVRNVVRRAIETITPSNSQTFQGCASCGGTFTFSPKADNLGRAGKLNKALPNPLS